MPPANSSNDSPPTDPDETSPYLQSLAAISSPVPNFAATLMTPDEQEINEANTNFLRARIPEPTDDESSATEPVDYQQLLLWYSRARDRQETLRTQRTQDRERLAARPSNSRAAGYWQSRSRPSWVQERRREMSRQANGNGDGDTSYANRTPQRQSLYDWAPYTSLGDDSGPVTTGQTADAEDDELPSYASYARYRWLERRQNSDQPRPERTPPRRQPRDEPSGRTRRVSISESLRNELGGSTRFSHTWTDTGLQREWERTRRDQLSSTEALLRSVDRLRRAQSRARNTINNSGWQSYAPLSGTGEDTRNGSSNTSTRLHRSEYEGDIDRHELPIPSQSTLRKKFLEDPTLMRLREVLRYLSKLRHCTGPGESQALMFSHFLSDSVMRDSSDSDSVIQELESFAPSESSWLTPGSTFCGTQAASLSAEEAAVLTHRPEQRNQTRRRDTRGQEDPDDIFVTTSAGRIYAADPIPDGPASGHFESEGLAQDIFEPNSWPVTVTIDTLDIFNKTLTGTMSASKIRDTRSPTGESSSTTYFEGEIIDLKKHSFETENFESEGLETDVLYWTRIGPFRGLDETEIGQRLLQRKWVEEELMQNWILMRWKERSFVPPTPAPNPGGISIRGFYYIALHRQSGRIDGSYGNHPESQPYQKLSMRPSSTTVSEPDHNNNSHNPPKGIRNQPSKSSISQIYKPGTSSSTATGGQHHLHHPDEQHILNNASASSSDNEDDEMMLLTQQDQQAYSQDRDIITSNGIYSSNSIQSIMRTGRDWTTSPFERVLTPEPQSLARHPSQTDHEAYLNLADSNGDIQQARQNFPGMEIDGNGDGEGGGIMADTASITTIPESEKIPIPDIAVRRWWPAYEIR